MGALKSKFRRSKSSSREKGDKPVKSKNKKKPSAVNLPESQSARKRVDPRLPFSNYRQIFCIRNAWKAISRTMEDCAKETLIRLFQIRPSYQKQFPSVKQLTSEDEMRHSDDFEIAAMDIYQVFDDVIVNLEEVDKALRDIKSGAMGVPLTQNMMTALNNPFMGVIRDTLGSDRFPETTEESFKLLFQFIQEEMCQYLEDVPDEEEVKAEVEDKQEDNQAHEVNNEEDKDAETEIVADTQVEVNICEDGGDIINNEEDISVKEKTEEETNLDDSVCAEDTSENAPENTNTQECNDNTAHGDT